MSLLQGSIWLLVIGLLAVAVWPRRRNKTVGATRAQPHHPRSPYGSVSVHASLGSCMSAWKLRGRRYLANDAPPLPLPWCDMDTCQCRYKYHEDRRSRGDRRTRVSHINPDLAQSGVYKPRFRRDRRVNPNGIPGSASSTDHELPIPTPSPGDHSTV